MSKTKKKIEKHSHFDTREEQIEKDTNKGRAVKRSQGGKADRKKTPMWGE